MVVVEAVAAVEAVVVVVVVSAVVVAAVVMAVVVAFVRVVVVVVKAGGEGATRLLFRLVSGVRGESMHAWSEKQNGSERGQDGFLCLGENSKQRRSATVGPVFVCGCVRGSVRVCVVVCVCVRVVMFVCAVMCACM